MKGKFEDLTGKVYGQLTVIERAPNIGKMTAWRCKCSCGKECVVRADKLKDGQQTCGCGQSRKTHGMSHTSIYRTWQHMIDRCENPTDPAFDRYGGRGIKVCERWHKFENFYDDVSKLEHFGEKGYTLDRIENDKDYCLENVRWADINTQNRNTRANVKVIYEGVEMCLMESAEKSGINYGCLKRRYHAGKRGADLFAPVRNYTKKAN